MFCLTAQWPSLTCGSQANAVYDNSGRRFHRIQSLHFSVPRILSTKYRHRTLPVFANLFHGIARAHAGRETEGQSNRDHNRQDQQPQAARGHEQNGHKKLHTAFCERRTAGAGCPTSATSNVQHREWMPPTFFEKKSHITTAPKKHGSCTYYVNQ